MKDFLVMKDFLPYNNRAVGQHLSTAVRDDLIKYGNCYIDVETGARIDPETIRLVRGTGDKIVHIRYSTVGLKKRKP
jgi:hypothetical protein